MGFVHPSLFLRCLSLVLLLSQCGPAKRPAKVEEVQLPTFTPEQSALFDDQIHPVALYGGTWAPDAKLSDQVLLSDSIIVAKITTASQGPSAAGQPAFTVVLRPLGEPLAGRRPPASIQLTLSPTSPSYRLFRWHQPLVLGKDVLLLYRHYRQAGDVRIHFRAEPNAPEVHAAVQQALSESLSHPIQSANQ